MSYCTILESEFDAIFKAEKNWVKELSGMAKEVVYTKSLKSKPWIQIRIYSTIHKNDGVSRGCGKDAIRVCAINTNTNRGVLKGKRINRVPGWNSRLENRVKEVWEFLVQN